MYLVKRHGPRVYYGHSVGNPKTVTTIGPEASNLLHSDDLDAFLSQRRKADLVTFDDGYVDNLKVVLPLLEKHSAKATIFITTGYVERTHVPMERVASYVALNRRLDDPQLTELGLAHLGPGALYKALKKIFKHLSVAERARYAATVQQTYGLTFDELLDDMLSPAQVAELDAHPLITIAAHTVSHPVLCNIPDSELANELRESKSKLEHWLDRPVTEIAYPFGSNDRRVRRATGEAGFTYAYTTEPKKWRRKLPIYGRFEIPRLDLIEAAVEGQEK